MSNFFTSGFAIPVPKPTTPYNGGGGMTFEEAMRNAEIPSTADLGVVIKRDSSGKIEMSTNTGISGGVKVETATEEQAMAGAGKVPESLQPDSGGMSTIIWIGIALVAAKVTRII